MFFTINDREKYIFNSQRYDTWFNRPFRLFYSTYARHVSHLRDMQKKKKKKNSKKEKNPSIVVSKGSSLYSILVYCKSIACIIVKK